MLKEQFWQWMEVRVPPGHLLLQRCKQISTSIRHGRLALPSPDSNCPNIQSTFGWHRGGAKWTRNPRLCNVLCTILSGNPSVPGFQHSFLPSGFIHISLDSGPSLWPRVSLVLKSKVMKDSLFIFLGISFSRSVKCMTIFCPSSTFSEIIVLQFHQKGVVFMF